MIRLLRNNNPSHTSELERQFLKSEKVTALSHPAYSPDLALFDFNFKKSYLAVVTCLE